METQQKELEHQNNKVKIN